MSKTKDKKPTKFDPQDLGRSLKPYKKWIFLSITTLFTLSIIILITPIILKFNYYSTWEHCRNQPIMIHNIGGKYSIPSDGEYQKKAFVRYACTEQDAQKDGYVRER